MRQYVPEEITAFAKEKAAEYPLRCDNAPECERPFLERKPLGVREKSGERTKIKVMGRDSLQLNRKTIDLRYVEQLVDSEQLMTLGYLLNYAQKYLMDGKHTMIQVVDLLYEKITRKGLGSVYEGSYLPSGLAMPRKQEIFACFDRYRNLQL